MRLFAKVFLLFLALLPPLTQAIEGTARDSLDQTLYELQTELQIPALAVAVITSCELVYVGGSGYIDEAQQVAVTGETTFCIASISKLFTGQCAWVQVAVDQLSTGAQRFGAADQCGEGTTV